MKDSLLPVAVKSDELLKEKSDMEVVMPYVEKIMTAFTSANIENTRVTTESNERLSIKNIESAEKLKMEGINCKFKENSKILNIVIIIAVIGGVTGTAMLFIGKYDIGFPIISSTLTGILGFLGGKSLSK